MLHCGKQDIVGCSKGTEVADACGLKKKVDKVCIYLLPLCYAF